MMSNRTANQLAIMKTVTSDARSLGVLSNYGEGEKDNKLDILQQQAKTQAEALC